MPNNIQHSNMFKLFPLLVVGLSFYNIQGAFSASALPRTFVTRDLTTCPHARASVPTKDVVDLVFSFMSRCPPSLYYWQTEFYNGYKKISDYVNLTMVIYTPANEEVINCYHGDNECYMSRVEVCALNNSGISQKNAVDFVYCIEEYAFDFVSEVRDAGVQQCLTSVLPTVSWDSVKSCMEGEESDSLLKEHFAIATEYGVDYSPWLTFNEVHDKDVEYQARLDFVGTICSLLTNPPDICSN